MHFRLIIGAFRALYHIHLNLVNREVASFQYIVLRQPTNALQSLGYIYSWGIEMGVFLGCFPKELHSTYPLVLYSLEYKWLGGVKWGKEEMVIR